MSFDSNVNCETTLLMDGLPKNVKNCFLKLCQLFRRLHVRLYNKSQQGFVTPNGLHGEAVESFSGYARSQVGGLAMVLFRCLAIFFNCCFPFAISYYDPLNVENCLECLCLPVTHQHLLNVHVIFGLREISLVVFSEKTYREYTAFWEVFSPDTLFFTWETVVNFRNLAALRQHLLNSG